jgi:hypothetical protein
MRFFIGVANKSQKTNKTQSSTSMTEQNGLIALKSIDFQIFVLIKYSAYYRTKSSVEKG